MSLSVEPQKASPLLSGHRVLDLITVGMTLPLFASYWIKHTLIPQAVGPLLYSWALVSVLVVPVLIVAQIAAIFVARTDRSVRRTHAFSACIAALGMAIFLVTRQL